MSPESILHPFPDEHKSNLISWRIRRNSPALAYDLRDENFAIMHGPEAGLSLLVSPERKRVHEYGTIRDFQLNQ